MIQTECVIVCTTLPVDADSRAFARTLVEERLAACVSAQPGSCSTYRWNDGVQQDEELQLRIKTTQDRLPLLEKRIRQLHPYDVPELIAIPIVGGGSAYLDWLRASTRGAV